MNLPGHRSLARAWVSAALAAGFVVFAPLSAAAQDRPDQDDTATRPRAEQVLPGRIGGDRTDRREQRQRRAQQEQPAAPTAEELVAQAQALAAVAAPSCQVTQATLLGASAEGHTYMEAVCASGPGYILSSATPPQAMDCVLLASQGRILRETDPAAEVGTQCALPANTDVVAVISGYAREAGVGCTVDDGLAIGRSDGGSPIYEVGCANAQGYWIEKTAAGWDKTECLQVITQNATCRFTTPADGAASVKAMLAGSDAAGCDVTQARFMGENSNGRFYEAKCAAGDGFIARIQETAVQQVYPCQEAQRIGGGCTLTQVAAAPATTEQN